MKLVAEGAIVHRDISDNNVLLGCEDAQVGWQGVLIDLNVAVDFSKTSKNQATEEARTGSRFFQSCAILQALTNWTGERAAAHDFLDDLEAFFYLLCRILLKCLKNGKERPATDLAWKVIQGWDSENLNEALNSKSNLFNPGRQNKRVAIQCVEKEWGSECSTLFKRFLEWVGGIQVEKERIRDEAGPQDPTKESIYANLIKQVDTHYIAVLGFFEEAIVGLGGTCKLPEGAAEPAVAGPSNAKRPHEPQVEAGDAHDRARARKESLRSHTRQGSGA